MTDDTSRVPKLRFPGFAGAWEQRKLSQVTKITMGQSPLGTNYTNNPNDHILVQGNADMKDGHVVPRVWTKQVTKKAEAGELILSVRAPVGDVGVTDFPVVLGRGVAGIQGNAFIFQLLSKMKIDNYWIKFSSGSTFESINSKDVKNAEVCVPTNAEQDSIGKFFGHLDETIALHQRKLSHLRQLKKGLLQKMFPKSGEDRPEVRFPGFVDAWEQRKLDGYLDEYTEKTTSEDQYPVLTSSQQQGIVFQTDYFANRQVTTSENIGYYVLPRGYFTYRSRSDNGIFKFNRNDLIDFGIISYFYPVFKIDNGDSNFFMQILNHSIIRQVDLESVGTGQRVLSMKKLRNIRTRIPSLDEQKKIGSLFSHLNNTIALHQRKLSHLQQQKKALLQQMFV
ncbi:type I restriction-modification system, specificity subunit S [Bifidobacterium minimum]|uniref:Type I restriction-modification system, specificity subunit S n=1 Tax=Bifidobacterium minimum TaxID=1693 RepID=A0A087BK16_9BIFI|nr:restriction endonuclease subunit S [Bifidobacterium minimum]KFI71366.1 type I restriction-modification system, specificity subunit S [Bifidobacterium minimum]